MNPDFSRNTIDILAKRAAYKCSNPDCRANTVGPNSDPEKITLIGEAAHIYGARIGSKRYDAGMTDARRSEITNSIWLCRNCHKLIDSDGFKYSVNILFLWREKHEEYIASGLASTTDRMLYEESISDLKEFENYPHIIKRIIIDKPRGWEYRLTAELMRFLNNPLYRKFNDLKSGLYLKPLEKIDEGDGFAWVHDRISEIGRMINPIVGLIDLMQNSWGKPGEPGDVKEIHHAAKLIKNYLEHVLAFEERIYFVNMAVKYRNLVELFKNLMSSQVEKLSCIPNDLDDIVSLIENMPENNEEFKTIEKKIVFSFPTGWNEKIAEELVKLTK